MTLDINDVSIAAGALGPHPPRLMALILRVKLVGALAVGGAGLR
jgi:hypothetical protein